MLLAVIASLLLLLAVIATLLLLLAAPATLLLLLAAAPTLLLLLTAPATLLLLTAAPTLLLLLTAPATLLLLTAAPTLLLLLTTPATLLLLLTAPATLLLLLTTPATLLLLLTTAPTLLLLLTTPAAVVLVATAAALLLLATPVLRLGELRAGHPGEPGRHRVGVVRKPGEFEEAAGCRGERAHRDSCGISRGHRLTVRESLPRYRYPAAGELRRGARYVVPRESRIGRRGGNGDPSGEHHAHYGGRRDLLLHQWFPSLSEKTAHPQQRHPAWAESSRGRNTGSHTGRNRRRNAAHPGRHPPAPAT
ncbi:hypothetical protein [Streptomyces sp. WELS2]|uniref:hypothetical protein n=1 Tax=Streptomyces sp. WELS2 TaxID=2749435 RepID=UPI0015F0083C|nr:hypothetical protein [Streptomyces sp. WELS2]